MRQLMVQRRDDSGGVWMAAKWFFLSAVLGLGVVTGQVAFLHAEVSELHHIANRLLSMNQGYSLGGQLSPESFEAGSVFVDTDETRLAKAPLAIPGRIGNKACD
jgi:hypothetical protein